VSSLPSPSTSVSARSGPIITSATRRCSPELASDTPTEVMPVESGPSGRSRRRSSAATAAADAGRNDGSFSRSRRTSATSGGGASGRATDRIGASSRRILPQVAISSGAENGGRPVNAA